MRNNSINNLKNNKIGCVIPCYKGGDITVELIKHLLKVIDLIVLVDDGCPLKTGNAAENIFSKTDKFYVLYNKTNRGVGFSVKKGFTFLIQQECDIIVKIDADGQMDPKLIPALISPIQLGHADAVKGNRFSSLDDLISMPPIRKIGNLGLSFLNKISTGYWELFDPTNGFIAFKADRLKEVRFEKADSRYFFESDLLFQSSLSKICFSQIAMKSQYGKEISSLNPSSKIFIFLIFHLINFFKRIIYQYFLLDFNIGSLEIIGFLISSTLLCIISIKTYYDGIFLSELASPGEANLISILAIISMQLLIGFFYFDATQQPLLRRLNQNRTI